MKVKIWSARPSVQPPTIYGVAGRAAAQAVLGKWQDCNGSARLALFICADDVEQAVPRAGSLVFP